MKSFIAILLASVFIFQSASKLIIIAGYEINKEYISKNLCENKAKPKMHCNGKCHLKKELQKEDKKENNPFQNVKEKIEIMVCSSTTVFNFSKFIPKNEAHFPYSFFIPAASSTSIFHPPQLA